ncbi:MAG: DUF1186 domain-containing protein [Anaerolineae bacterium]
MEDEEDFDDEAIEDLDAAEYPWGGDGTDLMKPVRAHVEAALVPTDAPYPAPVDQLLHLGDARKRDIRDRIAALGLTQAHVPELVRMARDRTLNTTWTETDQDWAPIHAMIALEALDVSGVVSDLIPLFDVDSDWFGSSLARALGRTGAAVVEPLSAYLRDRTRWIWGRAAVAEAMAEIGKQHPELRDTVVQIFTDELREADKNDATLNGSILVGLLDLDAVEALPVIRAAMEKNLIDESVAGDWQEVLNELGQEADPDDPLLKKPAFRPSWPFGFLDQDGLVPPEKPARPARAPAAPPATKNDGKAKQKQKRKAAQASRKANRAKKKRK